MAPLTTNGMGSGSGTFWSSPFELSELGGGGLRAINFSVSSRSSMYPNSS